MNEDKYHEFEFLMKNRPHVVLLGAGATMAAIPNGDKNGRKSSVMDGFIEKLGMSSVIDKVGLHTNSNNLEDIYTELFERPDCESVRKQLDKKIRKYFSCLEIPDEPNIYDLILLGSSVVAGISKSYLYNKRFARFGFFTWKCISWILS